MFIFNILYMVFLNISHVFYFFIWESFLKLLLVGNSGSESTQIVPLSRN